MVLEGDRKETLAEYTEYSHIIKSADKAILVFFDKKASYNHEKDLLAIGACIQNMLLCISSLGYGACWLGEILNQRKGIYEFLNTPQDLELEAVIALGKPLTLPKGGKRKQLKDLIV
jgi:nitroreductase